MTDLDDHEGVLRDVRTAQTNPWGDVRNRFVSTLRSFSTSTLALVLAGLVARALVDVALARHGYYYDMLPDSFSRTRLAWEWARAPFFDTGSELPFTWMPLQLWLGGLVFVAVRVAFARADVIVLAALNHLAFGGALWITCKAAKKISGQAAAAVAVVMATTMRTDIWTTFSGVSEPVTVFLGVVIAWETTESLRTKGSSRAPLLLGSAALLAAANHFLGWALAGFVGLFAMWQLIHTVRGGPGRRARLRWALCVSLSLVIPGIWMLLAYLREGSALVLLAKAADFHAPYVGSADVRERLLGPLLMLVLAEPAVLSISAVGSGLALLRNRSALQYLLPGVPYVAALIVSSVATWSLAYLGSNPRYVVLVYWLLIPISASLIGSLVRSAKTTKKVLGYCLIVAFAVVGIGRAFKYTNWVSEETRRVARVVRDSLEQRGSSSYSVVESLGSWEDQAIEVVIGYPDRVVLATTAELMHAGRGASTFAEASMWVLRDPGTIRELLPAMEILRIYDDYVIAVPSSDIPDIPQPPRDTTAWRPTEPGEFLLALPPDQVVVGFEDWPTAAGDAIGVERSIGVEPNGCYVVEVEARDYCGVSGRPWLFLQQLAVNGIVLWSHDIADDGFEGWQQVSRYVMPTGSSVDLEFRVLSLGVRDAAEGWERLSRLGIRGFRLRQCQ